MLRGLGISILFAFGAGQILEWTVQTQFLFFGGLSIVSCGFFIRWNWAKRADVYKIAAHLNRTYPELEESSELFLLQKPLTILQQIQAKRIEPILAKIKIESILPNNLLISGLKSLLILGLITVIVAFWAPQISSKKETTTDYTADQAKQAKKLRDSMLEIESVQIEIVPQNYTKLPIRTSKDFNLNVVEGTQINWQIRLNHPVEKTHLILNNLDTLNFSKNGGRNFDLKYRATESGFYYLDFQDARTNSTQSDYFQLEVIKDKPASILVNRPNQRTQIEYGQPKNVKLEVEVKDDYGFEKAKIYATVTSGSGESVRFREEMLDFDRVKKNSKESVELRKNLDLSSLGLNLGDELYFHLKAWDNRLPQPNFSRSETYFIILEDTTQAPVQVSAGIAINPIPAYFRSQRQIIIDTEKLVKEKDNISKKEFNIRSNNLGIDQKALRLRYGQFLGEEFDSGYGFAEAFGAETQPDPEQLGLDFLENHNEQVNQEGEVDVIEEFGHSHDSAENATLFAESIKEQLKAALAEMWDAEGRLRIHAPEQALPFEYRALVLLKRVQQRSRVFVQRVGFEPPPLEPDKKRLTGDLTKIEDVEQQIQQEKKETFTNIRKAFHILDRIRKKERNQVTQDIKLLERAGDELSQQALKNPGLYLSALQNLRQVIQESNQGEEICLDCVLEVERAFWRILPIVEPEAEKLQSTPSSLAKEYFRRLGL